MKGPRKTQREYQEEVLKKNAKINSATVDAHRNLERELKKLGVEVKPEFRLEPPLGRTRAGFHNRNSR